MEFPLCNATSVKADIAKGEIKVTFSMALSADNMTIAEELSLYVDKNGGEMELRIIPKQINFLKTTRP